MPTFQCVQALVLNFAYDLHECHRGGLKSKSRERGSG